MTDTPLTTRAEQAEAFKAYVHERLDEAGIPTHPAGPHSAAGCRIGDRLDIVLGRVAELTAALTEQGLLQKRADGSMVWHAHDCQASFDFAQCNYRCRVAREAFALAGTEPYVSQETRRDTEVYE